MRSMTTTTDQWTDYVEPSLETHGPIDSKKKMYALYRKLAFGNRPGSWQTLSEWEADWKLSGSDPGALFGVRETAKVGGRFAKCLSPDFVRQVVLNWGSDHYEISEMQDDSRLVLQGEVFRDFDVVRLFCSQAKMPMRDALKASNGAKNLFGLEAALVLKEVLDPKSWDNLNDLWDKWSGHVIEFSTYKGSVGLLGWNTIFWECRCY